MNAIKKTLPWTEEEIKLIEAVKKNEFALCSPNFNGTQKDISRIWWNIAKQLKMSEYACRLKWTRIKGSYTRILNKDKPPLRTRFLDGTLSFLDKYYTYHIKDSSPAPHDVVVIESDDETVNAKDYMVLDLEMIDNLLLKREPHEDIEMAMMEEILSLVSKRIEETMALNSHLNQVNITEGESDHETIASETFNTPTNEINMSSEIIELDDGSDCDSNTQSPKGGDMDVEIISDSLENAVRAFPSSSQDNTADGANTSIPIASLSIPVPEKSPQNSEDMETVFDIHRRCNTKTFFRELGRYVNRFSKERQEEIRLKICCVVTEVELEDIN